VLARVHIEHELDQRPMEARDRAAQHDEPATRKLRGRIEIDEAEPLAERDVIERRKRHLGRRAPPPHLDVRVRVTPVGNALVKQVRQAGKKLVELRGDLGEALLARFERLAERADLASQRLDVLASGLRAADRLRTLVARLA
jgi:hypothetical protein